MKSLDKLLKRVRLFSYLTLVVTIFFCVYSVLKLISVALYYAQARIDSTFLQNIIGYVDYGSFSLTSAHVWSDFVYALADIFSFGVVYKYLRGVLEEGTPFTHHSAKHVMYLGIKTMVLPIIAETIAVIIYVAFGEYSHYSTHMPISVSIIFGIVLLLVALLIRHGAELKEETEDDDD